MQNYVITITRQFGSRGRDIGIATAKKLGIPLYDRNVLEKEAEEIDSTLHSLVEFSKNGMSSSGYYKMAYPLGIGSSLKKDRMFEVQSKLVLQHAETENCVIIGRCADYLLREMNPFRIFVYADTESKLKRCMERSEPGEHLTEKELRKKMKDVDRSRAQYCEFCSQQKWGDKSYYDLLINTSGKNIKQLSNSLYEYLK